MTKIVAFIENRYKYFYIFLLLLAAVLCFYKLGNAFVDSWDEARHGVNAYEMIRTNNYIVSHFRYSVDYYNLKPPLSYWLIIFGYKLFGYNPLGLRFYSALSFFLTIVIVSIFLNKRYGKLESLVFLLFACSFSRLYSYHMARSGDADAFFVFLFTNAILLTILSQTKISYLYAAGFNFSLAFLTKSWHAGTILILIGLLSLTSGVVKRIKPKDILLFLLSSILPILIWGVMRYPYDGFAFFQRMVTEDLFQRSASTIEGHSGDYLYYLQVFIESKTGLACLLLIGSVACITLLKGKPKLGINLLSLILWLVVPILLFSVVSTKLPWYIYPSTIPLMMLGSIATKNIVTSNLPKMLVIGFLMLPLLLIGIDGLTNGYIIYRSSQNSLQSFIETSLQTDQSLQGKELYFDTADGNGWEQGNVLVAEWYGNSICKDGGVEQFSRDQDSFCIVDKERWDDLQSDGYEVIYENDQYYLLGK